jgi:hypothetical protein
MVVGPGVFEAVSEFVYRLDALGTQNEKASRCSAQTAYDPEQILHDFRPPMLLRSIETTFFVYGWMQSWEFGI